MASKTCEELPSSSLLKTKICKFFLKGQCKFGEICKFAHSELELKNFPDLRKTRMCKSFKQSACFINNCAFAHERCELKATAEFFKTSLCKFWPRGLCTAGESCRHAHGSSELRNSTNMLFMSGKLLNNANSVSVLDESDSEFHLDPQAALGKSLFRHIENGS